MSAEAPINPAASSIAQALTDPDDSFDGLDYIKARQIAGRRDAWVRKVGDTPSMLGSGYNKKWVIVEEKPEYAIGDDVVFHDERHSGDTLHRVTAIKPGFVYVKGTFNQMGDGWVPLKDVMGHVTLPKRKQ